MKKRNRKAIAGTASIVVLIIGLGAVKDRIRDWKVRRAWRSKIVGYDKRNLFI